jgi:hypothetical protein
MGEAGAWSEGAQIAADALRSAPCCSLLALLGARVAALCEGGAACEGLLYSVDPETRTLVLLEVRTPPLPAGSRHAALTRCANACGGQGCCAAVEHDRLHARRARVVLIHALTHLTGALRCAARGACARR